MSDCTATSVRFERTACTHRDKRVVGHRDNCFWDPNDGGWVDAHKSLKVLHCTEGPLHLHKSHEAEDGYVEFRHVTDGGVWWDSDVGSTPHEHDGQHEWGNWIFVTETDMVRQCLIETCQETQEAELVVGS